MVLIAHIGGLQIMKSDKLSGVIGIELRPIPEL